MHCTFPMDHTPSKHSATSLVRKDAYWCVALAGWMSCSQVLFAAVVRPLKDPEIAVTLDPVLIERETSRKTRNVWKNAKAIPTVSIPMAQKARSHGATPLPCVLGYRAAAMGKFVVFPVKKKIPTVHRTCGRAAKMCGTCFSSCFWIKTTRGPG